MSYLTTLCFFPDAFYPNPAGFDGPAAYMPPPPYSAPLGQQAPHNPDLPSTPAGQNTFWFLLSLLSLALSLLFFLTHSCKVPSLVIVLISVM